jgi:hypothetical protein
LFSHDHALLFELIISSSLQWRSLFPRVFREGLAGALRSLLCGQLWSQLCSTASCAASCAATSALEISSLRFRMKISALTFCENAAKQLEYSEYLQNLFMKNVSSLKQMLSKIDFDSFGFWCRSFSITVFNQTRI